MQLIGLVVLLFICVIFGVIWSVVKINELNTKQNHLQNYLRFLEQQITQPMQNIQSETKEAPNCATEQPEPKPDYASAAYKPMPPRQQAYYPPPSAPPVTPPSPPPMVPQERQRHTPTKTESMVGRNVLGIAASVLVFIGLIFLGLLIYEYITVEIKILLMFAFSTIITGVGVVLCIKVPNAFTKILTGCGCGSFFISIILTHIYFGKINDLTAFSMLLLWTAAVLFLARSIKSVSISVVAHIGMVFSICFAYMLGLSDEKLLLLLIYQAASITVIIVGNILCCKKTYRFGVFISLALTIVASSFMWVKFQPAMGMGESSLSFHTGLPVWVIAAAFIAQFLCASFLSYLLSVSVNHLKNELWKYWIHIINKLLWIILLFMDVYWLTFCLVRPSGTKLQAVFAAVSAAFLLLVLHACLSIGMQLKQRFKKELETLSVLMITGTACVLLLILWVVRVAYPLPIPNLLFLLLPAGLLGIAKIISKNRIYSVAVNILLGADLLFMLSYGYHELTRFGTVVTSTCYMMIYIAAIWVQWFRCDDKRKNKYSITGRIVSYLITEASLAVIFLTSTLTYKHTILLIVLTVINLLAFLFRFDGRKRDKHSPMYLTMRINTLLLIALNSGCIAFASKDGMNGVLYLILSMLTLGLALSRIKEDLFAAGIQPAEEIRYILKIILLVIGIVYGYTSCLQYSTEILLFTVTGLGILLFILRRLLYRFNGCEIMNDSIDTVMKIIESIWVAVNLIFIAFAQKNNVTNVLYLLLAALTAGLAFMRAKDLFTVKINFAEELAYGIKLTGLALAVVQGHTIWFENTYVISLICMMAALASIIVGFITRAKTLRLYGLVLTLLCVLKLVTYDVASASTVLRVIVLISGGIICFAISAIYSYSVKKINKMSQNEEVNVNR